MNEASNGKVGGHYSLCDAGESRTELPRVEYTNNKTDVLRHADSDTIRDAPVNLSEYVERKVSNFCNYCQA